jgi:hypothetical protein
VSHGWSALAQTKTTWGRSVQVREEEDEDGHRVKIVTSAVSLVPIDKLDKNTAAATHQVLTRRVAASNSVSRLL